MRVNWETTSAAPPVSRSERRRSCPSASSKIRSRATLRGERGRRPASSSLHGDAEQDAEAGPDLAAGRDAGPGDALDDRAHPVLVELADPRGVAARSPGPSSSRACSARSPRRRAPASRACGRARSGRSRRSARARARARNSASASSQRCSRKYAIPSASRIEALSGSSRFAFSSGTVACAFMPLRRRLRPSWKRS